MKENKLREVFNKSIVQTILSKIKWNTIKQTREEVEKMLYELPRNQLELILEYNDTTYIINFKTFGPVKKPEQDIGYWALSHYINVEMSSLLQETIWVSDKLHTPFYAMMDGTNPITCLAPNKSQGFLPKQQKDESNNLRVHHKYGNKNSPKKGIK